MGSSTFMVLLAVTTILAGFQAEAEAAAPAPSGPKVYIVFLDQAKGLKPQVLLQSVFQSLSESALGSSKHATEALVYEYHTLGGFSARLSTIEAQKLSESPGVLAVLPDQIYKIDDPYKTGIE